jgi:hypothetical protein
MAVDDFGFPIKTEEVTEEVTEEKTQLVDDFGFPIKTEEVTEEKTQLVDDFGFPIKTLSVQPTETTEIVDDFGFPIKTPPRDLINPEDVSIGAGLMESASQGLESFEDVGLGIKLAYQKMTGDMDGANETMRLMKAGAAEDEMTQLPTLSAADIQRIAEEKGYVSAGAQVPEYIAQNILKSGPQMAVPIAVALGVAAVSGPFAPITAPIAGITAYGIQQFGNFMNTQGLEKEFAKDTDVGQAAKWATITAPIGFVVDKFTFGVGKLGTKETAKEIGKELAKRGAVKTIGTRATGGAVTGFITEAPTEVLETWAELHQAGIDTSSEAAYDAYYEAWWAGGSVGGGIKTASTAIKAYKDFKQSELESKKPLEDKDINTDEKIEESRQAKIKSILTNTKELVAKDEAKEINKTPITVFDAPNLKKLGIPVTSTAHTTLQTVDLTTPEGQEMAETILTATIDKETGLKSVNKQAVKNTIKQIQKSKEALNALTRPRRSKPSPTGKSAGVSQLESEQSQPTPSGTQNLDGDSVVAGGGRTTTTTGPETRVDAPLTDQEKALKIEIARKYLPRIEEARKKLRPLEEAELAKVNGDQAATYKLMAKQEARRQKAFMEINDEGMAEFEASRGRTTTTTGPETRVDAPLIDNPKNPIIKNPKIGSKVRIGRINNGKPEVLKGVIQEDPKLGRVLVSEEQGGTRIIPLTNSQILNPTTNDVTQLDSLANRIKESKSKKQQLLDTKKEKEDSKPSMKRGKMAQKQVVENLKPAKTIGQVFNQLGTIFKSYLNPAQQALLTQLRKLPNIKNTKFKVTPGLENRRNDNRPSGKEDTFGQYYSFYDTVEISDNADVETILHETTHAATTNEIRKHVRKGKGVDALGRRIVQLYDQAKAAAEGAFVNELNTVDEFITEAFNNKEFQLFLAKTPSTADTPSTISSLWTDFVQAVSDMLGLGDISGTLLNDVLAVAPELMQGPNAEAQARGPNAVLPQRVDKPAEKQMKERIEKLKTPREKQKALSKPIVEKGNFGDPSYVGPIDKMKTLIFSFDAALNSAMTRAMKKLKMNFEDMKDVLLETSASQALHAETVAQAFLEYGEIVYDMATKKFRVVANSDAPSLRKVKTMLKSLADKSGVTLKTMQQLASKAITARRAQQLQRNNEDLEMQAKSLVAQGKVNEARKLLEEGYVIIPETDAQIKEALKIFDDYPELNDIADMWIDVKNNTVRFLVEHEVLSPEQAEEFINVVGEEGQPADAYVPFFREEGPEPQQYSRGLGTRGKQYRLKGSYEPVADVFDNMDKWVRSSIKQGILNRAAINKIEAAFEYLPNDIKEVPSVRVGENTVAISRVNPKTGKRRVAYYEFSSPFFARAIGGMESGVLSGVGFLANAANFLRTNIILYPTFAFAQLPQDSISAMFSSGTKYPFMIPLRVLKEFPLTLIDMSKTHTELKRQGATGGFAFLQNDNKLDSDIDAPGFFNTLRRAFGKIPGLTQGNVIQLGNKNLSLSGLLNRIAMASDNAVRQAVYEQVLLETGDAGIALEKAFEIINFRRAGSNKYVTMGRQYIPFFGAALQALSVQGQVITMDGVAPTTRAKALTNFVTAWGSLAGMTLVYNMLKGEDEEFKKLDPKLRDRAFIIGDDGFHLKLRPDLFTFLGKVMPEHVIQNMVFESEDAKKFWDSLKRNATEIVALNLLPQLLRPLMEIKNNYATRTGQTIMPQSLEGRDITQQYTPGTSEAAKLIGQLTGVAPPYVDYFFRQYMGYSAGLMFMMLDSAIDKADIFKYDRPEKSTRDQLASIPGMGAFVSRDQNNRLTSDYYELKKEVDAAVTQFNDLDRYGFDLKRTLKNRDKGNNEELITANKTIKSYNKKIGKIRESRRELMQAPRDMISAAEKKIQLDILKQEEENVLGSILDLRKQVYGTDPFANF